MGRLAHLKQIMTGIQVIFCFGNLSMGESDQCEDEECWLILAVSDLPNGSSKHLSSLFSCLVGKFEILGIVK